MGQRDPKTSQSTTPAGGLPIIYRCFIEHQDVVPFSLTDGELEVLRMIASGMSNQEIGVVLGIGARAAKRRVADLLRRMAVDTPSQAVTAARKRDWLPAENP